MSDNVNDKYEMMYKKLKKIAIILAVVIIILVAVVIYGLYFKK